MRVELKVDGKVGKLVELKAFELVDMLGSSQVASTVHSMVEMKGNSWADEKVAKMAGQMGY